MFLRSPKNFLLIPLTILWISSFISLARAATVTHFYDDLNRLTQTIYKDGSNPDTTYHVRAYATDSAGADYNDGMSFTAETEQTQCQECSVDPVVLTNVTFSSGTNCECNSETSITIGSGVTIENGAAVTFKAPRVNLKSYFHAQEGAVVNIQIFEHPDPVGKEYKIVDQTFKFTYEDNGFHPFKVQGEYIPGVPEDWTKPDDFYNGEWHFRYEVLSPSNQQAGRIQTCIWNMPGFKPESCSFQVTFDGVGTYELIHIPEEWWKYDGVPLDFSDHEPFLIRAVLRGSDGCNVTRYSVSRPCWDQWPKYENTLFRVTIVMVPKGKSFSGWENYP